MTSSHLNFHGDKRANNYTSVGPCKMTIKNREQHLLDLVREKNTSWGIQSLGSAPRETALFLLLFFNTSQSNIQHSYKP